MMRSMSTAISGLRAHQVMMDVVSNNIANVNTVGFKASRVTFQEVLNQTLQPAFSGVTSTTGGTTVAGLGGSNPQQVGLGVGVASVDVLDNSDAYTSTSRGLDAAIDGNGYFAVTDGSNIYYTRDGDFNFDNSGNLVTSNGDKVLGANTTSTVPTALAATDTINIPDVTKYTNVQINSNGTITGVDTTSGTGTSSVTVLATIGLTDFSNPQGLLRVGSNMYSASSNSGTPTSGTPGTPASSTSSAYSTLKPEYLESSNVDLGQELTNMIIAQRGFQANSKVITTASDMMQELTDIVR